MRQKEVMGQSIRTSKSARPGTITYVPIDKSEFRSTVSSDKKKNKIMKIVVMLIVMILVMSCCVYAGISYYYSYHFFLGTTINGIDSSNKTAYEVEQEIAGKKDNYVIQVSARMQEPQTITGKDIDYQYVSSGEILQLLKTQKPWEWIRGFFETKNYMVQEETVFSREKLEEQVSSLNCAKKENQIAPENAYVSFSNSEFTIVPETEGSELNAKEAYQMISRAIDNEAADVDLGSNPKAYKEADVTRDSSELQNMVNMYNSLAKVNITYTFGDETVTLDGNTIKNWLQFDEKGQLLQNDEAFRQHVVDYVAQLAADHDTVGTERQFETTSGRIVYVYGSAYGWKIDQDKEAAQLMQEIQSGTQTTREPVYSMRANAHGINDLGNGALREQLEYDGSDLPDSVYEQLATATEMYYRFDANLEQKKKAINILADILESEREEVKDTLNAEYEVPKNEHDKLIFGIVNGYNIRHNRADQKNDYSKEIWYDWMMQYYTSVIIAFYKLKNKYTDIDF